MMPAVTPFAFVQCAVLTICLMQLRIVLAFSPSFCVRNNVKLNSYGVANDMRRRPLFVADPKVHATNQEVDLVLDSLLFDEELLGLEEEEDVEVDEDIDEADDSGEDGEELMGAFVNAMEVGGERMEEDLQLMQTALLETSGADIADRMLSILLKEERATLEHVQHVLHLWQEESEKGAWKTAAKRVYSTFRLFQDTCMCSDRTEDDGIERMKPSLEMLNQVGFILSHVKGSRTRRDEEDPASFVFRSISEDFGMVPNRDSYEFLVAALARSKNRGAAQRADRVLREALEKFPPELGPDGENVGMSIAAFNVVLTAWAKDSNNDESPERAQRLIISMDDLDDAAGRHGLVKPDLFSFTSMIDAYAQKNVWESTLSAENILNRLVEQHIQGELHFEPDVTCWTIVISSFLRLAKKGLKGAPERAYRLLFRMKGLSETGKASVKPDKVAYYMVMNAWTKMKGVDAAKRAEELLNEMEGLYLKGDEEMKPGIKSHRNVISSWVNTKELSGLEHAETLLAKAKKLHPDASPEEMSEIYKTLVFGWSMHQDIPKAEKYLREMAVKGMKPDSFCYDKVIEGYTKSGLPDATQRVMGIFELMEEGRKANDIKPNERVYTSFMRALAQGRVNQLMPKVQVIFKRMQRMYEQGNKGIKPTIFTYNALLNAAALSDDKSEEEKMQAFEAAIGIYNELRRKEKPDHVTFGTLLRCANLLPDGERRTSLIDATFDQCCQRGILNEYVVRDLISVAPESKWRSLLRNPQGDLQLAKCPPNWTRNVKRRDNQPIVVRVSDLTKKGS